MKWWPTSAKDKRIKELELAIEDLVHQLYANADHSTTAIHKLRQRVDSLTADLSAARALAVARHKRIDDLKGIINQLEARGNDRD